MKNLTGKYKLKKVCKQLYMLGLVAFVFMNFDFFC